MPQIGVRLPEDVYLKVHDRRRAVHHTRLCQECGFKWPTVEVAMVRVWEGKRFDRCHIHYLKPAKSIVGISIDRAMSGDVFSKALKKIVSWGGYYRRRECQARVTANDRCGARWTTAEVDAAGLICENVQKCPRCGSHKSRITTRVKSSKEWK